MFELTQPVKIGISGHRLCAKAAGRFFTQGNLNILGISPERDITRTQVRNESPFRCGIGGGWTYFSAAADFSTGSVAVGRERCTPTAADPFFKSLLYKGLGQRGLPGPP